MEPCRPPGSKREVTTIKTGLASPPRPKILPKPAVNWFGGIVSFVAKKSLPTTSRNWLTNTGARRENAACLISQVRNGPAEPSLFAHRITCFRSHSRLCWDLLSVLELPGCAGCRACAHLLGKRNGHHSELRWGNAVRVKSYFVHLRWRHDFRKRRGDNGCREPKTASTRVKNAPPRDHAARFRRGGARWRIHQAAVGWRDGP